MEEQIIKPVLETSTKENEGNTSKEKIHVEKHGIPALLSFLLPGLGQIVKGEFGKGILIFLGMIISSFLMVVLVGFILTPILFIWNVYDAYNTN